MADGAAAGRRGREVLTWAAVAIGVALRLLEYAGNRPLYMDERSLLEEPGEASGLRFPHDVDGISTGAAGLPGAGAARCVRLPGDDVMAARFFPLACGVASMFLFRAAARRFLLPDAVPIAVGLFALSDWLIYYSAEIKQYSCDLALALVALLLAAGPARGRHRLAASPGTGRPVRPGGSLPGRLRRDRRLVLLSTRPRARGSGDVPTCAIADLRGGTRGQGRRRWRRWDWPGWSASPPATCVSHGILEQGAVHLGLVGFRLLARAAALGRRAAARPLAARQRLRQPGGREDAMGPIADARCSPWRWSVVGSVSCGRWPGGLYLLVRPVVVARWRPRPCVSIRSTAGC